MGLSAAKTKCAAVSKVVPLGAAVMVVRGGVASTIQVQAGGLGSRLPARSTARTSMVYEPSASPAMASGVGQAANGAGGRRHSKVAPALVAVKVSVAAREFVSAGGPAMEVPGGRVSTVKPSAPAGPTLPAASVAVA